MISIKKIQTRCVTIKLKKRQSPTEKTTKTLNRWRQNKTPLTKDIIKKRRTKLETNNKLK